MQSQICGLATDVVWLDYSRSLIMMRVIVRSFRRAVQRTELWPGTGNIEAFNKWFSSDHPIRLSWENYQQKRAQLAAIFAQPQSAHLRVHRLRHTREAEELVAELKRLAAVQGLQR